MPGLKIAITGASRGIGLGLATMLHNRGEIVYGLVRSSSEALSALALKGGIIEGIDVGSDEVGSVLQSKMAGIELDVLINNSGILYPDGFDDFKSTSTAATSLANMRQQMEINVYGPLKVTAALVSGGQLKSGARVGIVSSIMGSIEDNSSGGMYGYRSSKAAVNMVGKSLAGDLRKDNICVQLWHPGYIDTDMTSRFQSAGKRSTDDCAAGILQLLDAMDMSSTGTFWHANYGEGVKPIAW
jgi:NAD(P)-dependent dehydrogenase (short-subunit alcohol dehydrogenase family)